MSTPTIRVISPRDRRILSLDHHAAVVLDSCVFGDVSAQELLRRQERAPIVLDLLIRDELLLNEKILRDGHSTKSDTRRIMLDRARKVLPFAYVVDVARHERYALERSILDPLSALLPKSQAVSQHRLVLGEWYSSLAYLVDWRECTYGVVGINDIRNARSFASQFMYELLEDNAKSPPKRVRRCRDFLLRDRAQGAKAYSSALSTPPLQYSSECAMVISDGLKTRLLEEYGGAVQNVWKRIACASLAGENEDKVSSRLLCDAQNVRADQHVILASYLFPFATRETIVYSADKDVGALASLRMCVASKYQKLASLSSKNLK